jgi:hypothetical protein
LIGNNGSDKKLQLKGQDLTGKSSALGTLTNTKGSALRAIENLPFGSHKSENMVPFMAQLAQ